MKSIILKRFKIISAIMLAVLALLIMPSCEITPAGTSSNGDSQIDAKTLIDGVYENQIITANFLVEHVSWQSSVLGGRLNEATSKGSAVIFDVNEPTGNSEYYTYYLLSNNHVVYESPSYTNFECNVIDCYGDGYLARVLVKDASYDLSILSFQSKKLYSVLEFSLLDPKVDDTVISIGSPLGVLNAVTVGKVVKYETVDFGEEVSKEISNVEFSAIKHDCLVNNGSSGGVLLDDKYRVCGINFAAEIDNKGEFVAGYAVQISKVLEFINMQK